LGIKQKVIYLPYMFWILVYTFLFFTFGVIIAKFLDGIFPSATNENELEQKSKIITIIEIYLQIGLMVISAYIFREYINAILKTHFNIYKKPDKFAVLIISSTMFSQQPNLKNKIVSIFN
jgi:hypothetical protein